MTGWRRITKWLQANSRELWTDDETSMSPALMLSIVVAAGVMPLLGWL